MATTERVALPKSSMLLTTGAPMPAVVAFTTGRTTDLAPCTVSEIRMPSAIGTHWWLLKNVPGSWTVTVPDPDAAPNASPPAVGRTTVWITPLTWSTTGTLSATTSIDSSRARIAITHPLASHCQDGGRSIKPVYRSKTPTASSGMYALSPAEVARPTPVNASSTHSA